MSNSIDLAKAARFPLAVFGKDEKGAASVPEEWSPDLVDEHVADLIADLLHYAEVYGEQGAEATLERAKKYYDEENEEE